MQDNNIVPLPSPQEALQFNLPDDFWLKCVGPHELNKEDNKSYITSLHLINGEGRVVCNCDIHPLTSNVYRATRFPLEHRYLYCQESVTYLRRVVRRLIQKGVQSEE